MKDLNGREITALVPVSIMIIALGVFPAPLLNVIEPAVDRIMITVGATDPEITVGLVPSAAAGIEGIVE
jgi:NADH-quinone oxidoreductase subunit M